MIGWASTGQDELDKILCGLNKGDNVVWQVDSIEDYKRFVTPYVTRAIENNRKVIYMRFGNHKPVVEQTPQVKLYNLDAESGFEIFSTRVHAIISAEGTEAHYVFDCLSDLLSAWATDLMIGNFFRVTCPYLFDLDTIAYFAILRDHHSFKTIARIRGTTQLLLDLYNFQSDYYVHPLKVWNRYSPTMFLPHLKKGNRFCPISSSIEAAKLFAHISEKGLRPTARSLDYWDQLFLKAETLRNEPRDRPHVLRIVTQLSRIMIGRDTRMAELAQKTFTLDDLINIKSRLVGTGFVGGKTAGMLIAQKILADQQTFDWNSHLEQHDSFFVGSDVFYTYIVENGWWQKLMDQKTKEGYFKVAAEMKDNLLRGTFPDEIREQFREIIDYFGQSPIIVRSSSLLEDSFGNAFAGKYESIFLVNQGDPERRCAEFDSAVRRIYASTMNVNALTYRLQRGLDQADEQMALLVQRVSGSTKGSYFFPDLAGVGVSHNTFVWKPDMDPKAGMVRLVLGLGTRAVDRTEGDYPQIIALDQPLRRPYSDAGDTRKFSQHRVDLLDIRQNRLRTLDFTQLLEEKIDLRLNMIAATDTEATRQDRQLGRKRRNAPIITFEKLLCETDFTDKMRQMLTTLEQQYEYPIDVEFTVNFTEASGFKVNLVQCRPLQIRGLRANVRIEENVPSDKILFESQGYTMGGNISQLLARIVYVEPAEYVDLTWPQKYDIARLMGTLNRKIPGRDSTPTMLLGPGRWGTTTPSLGVPVNFAEICNITVLGEIAYEGGNLMPELSFGTHFFQDLVESEIFYLALFPQRENVVFNKDRLAKMPNHLTHLAPEAAKYEHVVKVYEFGEQQLQITCDVLSQKVTCYMK